MASPSNNNNSQSTPPVSPNRIKIDGKEQDVKSYVSSMLEEMETDFEQVGNSLLNRMHRISSKMDALENSIGSLMTDAGLAAQKQNNISPTASTDSQDSKPVL